MLLDFQFQNYKSFLHETTFSMLPATRQTELSYSILKDKVEKKDIRALCSSVIYGPNASGKTNLIGAMEVFQSIISRGHIRNMSRPDSPNYASNNLELIPNSTLTENKPVRFAVSFLEKKLIIQYSLTINLGLFCEKESSRFIQEEELTINGKKVFTRDPNTLNIFNPSIESRFIHWPLPENSVSLAGRLQQNLNSQELFLTGGFKSGISNETAELVLHWIIYKFRIVYQASLRQASPDFPDKQSGRFYVIDMTHEVAKTIGIGENEVGYIYSEEEKRMQLSSNIQNKITIIANAYESIGTIRMINLFPLLADTLIHGGTLVIDEFDASIHPMALMSIINIFHNNDINKKHAQLIFNTHNPILLNRNLFRRDEIKFIDRNDKDHVSDLYSLSDFGTTGKNGVRKNDDYMKNYFIDRYGAIRNIDFSPIFEKIMDEAGNNYE